jgi:hypothetical protein
MSVFAPAIDKPGFLKGHMKSRCKSIPPFDKNFNTFPCIIVLPSTSESKCPVFENPNDVTSICMANTMFKLTEP